MLVSDTLNNSRFTSNFPNQISSNGNILFGNYCLLPPGLQVGSAPEKVKWGNTFAMVGNNCVSQAITTADAPGLATALGPGGVASFNLPDSMVRTYTLLALVDKDLATVSFRWVFNVDHANSLPVRPTELEIGDALQSETIVGFLSLNNGSGVDWVPGTTGIAVANGIYIDKFGF